MQKAVLSRWLRWLKRSGLKLQEILIQTNICLQYSWGGCSLCYDVDIAARLCTPSELRKTRNGERRPNGREEWLDVQTRAIHQAANRIFCAAKAISREEAQA